MRHKIETYLKNFNRVISLDDMNDFHRFTKGELFKTLQENAVTKQKIAEENNGILKEILEPLEEKKFLTPEELENIEYFVHNLQQGFESMDNGMLYRLYKILLADAMQKDDVNRIVSCIYYFSYYEFILQSTFPRGERNCSWDLIENYVKDYDKLTLEGKKYFLRCYGNRMLSKEYSYQECKKIYDFIAEKKKTDPNPEIPYDAYLLAIDKNICNGVEIIRNYDAARTPAPKELVDGVYESACRVHDNIHNVANTSVPVKQVYQYIYYAMQFHKGFISIDDFLARLKELATCKEEYTIQEKSSSIIKMNMYWIYYMRYKTDDIDLMKKLISKTVEEILEFVQTLKPSDYTRNMNSDLLSFMQSVASFYPYDSLEELYIKATTRRHTPTLIHSKSVAGISKILTEEMLESNPDFFVGVADDFDKEYISTHHEELINLSYRMGMMHDVGKYYCIPFISINHRRLNDAEYETIKRHPYFGHNLVRQAVSSPIRDAILFHHTWHNHNGGYPLDYDQTNNQPLVDILSIADSIDAAVDFLGRSYAHSKRLKDLVEEFKGFKDTRYSKEVVELFENKKVFDRVEKFLNEERQEIVYQAFCQA